MSEDNHAEEKKHLIDDGFRDTFSNVDDTGHRKWVYALKPEGIFYRWRNLFAWLCLGIFFILPMIQWQGMPFFMLNVIDGKFIIFGKIFWPNDFFIFAIGMIVFIVFIALFTLIFGRLFCGWVCPQTIFLEFVFRKIEWWIEGSPTQQKKLNASEWSGEKIRKKTLKHLIFFLISFLIANTFLSYIIGLPDLIHTIRQPLSENYGLLLGLFAFTLIFYGVFAYVRDIVCTTICPYGRLQSVLFDKDTMQISYDYVRGEPRGKISKNSTVEYGDCIDCKMCVHVCPTGIDIRNGVQMECVGCTACIDACDKVMVKIDRPKGLIRYASENEIADHKPFKFTSKMKGYSIVLTILLLLLGGLLVTRKSIDAHIVRTEGQLYEELPGNKLSNLYQAKIINKTNHELPIDLKMEGEIQGEIKIIGTKQSTLKPEAVTSITFFSIIDKKLIQKRSTIIKIGVYSKGEKIQTIKTKFLGPIKNL